MRLRVAQAELRREAGLDELIALAAQGPTQTRVLALRGLGRIGAPINSAATPLRSRGIDALIAALGDSEPAVVGAAAAALGVVAALDGVELAVDTELTGALARAGTGAGRLSVLEALGNAGGAATQVALVNALAEAETAEVAALALGRHGRRAIALSAEARAALIPVTTHAAASVRYAAVYALAREAQAPQDAAVVAALWARLTDSAADVRAQAISALNRRKALAAAAPSGARPERLLYDPDFRVAVEAARALGANESTRAEVTSALGRWLSALTLGAADSFAHVIVEAEKVLSTSKLSAADQSALSELASRAVQAEGLPVLTRGWIDCYAQQALVRAQAEPDFAKLTGCGLPDEWRLPLVAELIDAGVGSVATRRSALAALIAHRDPRVRAAGVSVLGAQAKSGEAEDRSYAHQQLVAALGAQELMVVAAAGGAAPGVYEVLSPDEQTAVDAALLERVKRERDPEVGAALLGLVGERKLSAGAESCRGGLSGNPVLAAAAAGCLEALGETLPEAAAVSALPALPEDIDPAAVIGKQLRWRLQTSRGDVEIALRSDVAPWTVATIVALTRRGTYDGLAFHRVVPNFVVQGGDPTESGYGGPGFAIPVEPATVADSTGYVRGGVGVADAGRDSGGSQFFIMHGRAPYLDARYSWFGSVTRGQRNADALLMGDEILHATIETVQR